MTTRSLTDEQWKEEVVRLKKEHPGLAFEYGGGDDASVMIFEGVYKRDGSQLSPEELQALALELSIVTEIDWLE